MENDNPGYEVMQIQQDQSIIQFDAVERANVDSQVATAKQYPRDIARCVNNSIAMATIDYETAKSCGYALHVEESLLLARVFILPNSLSQIGAI